jgi:hypothetical protein
VLSAQDLQMVRLFFTLSQTNTVSGEKLNSFTFVDFLEAIARIADEAIYPYLCADPAIYPTDPATITGDTCKYIVIKIEFTLTF